MALAEDDPYVEELIEDASAAQDGPAVAARAARGRRSGRTAARRGRRARASWRPPARALSPLGAIALIAAYALTQRVQFDVGAGYTVPSQLVFMPMLLLAPPALVPLLVAAELARRPPADATCAATSTRRAWSSSSPTPSTPSGRRSWWRCSRPARIGLDDWPVLALALAAQAFCDAGVDGPARSGSPSASRRSVQLRLFVWVFAVDAALAPGRRPGRRRRRAPAARRRCSSCRSWACSPSSPASGARASTTRWRSRTPTAAPRC